MVPVKPSEIEACIIHPSDPPCTIWRNLLKSFYLFWQVRNYENNDEGGIGTGLAEDMCAYECPEVITD